MRSGSLYEIQKALSSMPTTTTNGASYLQDVVGAVDCVRYTPNGIEFETNGRTIQPPLPDEVLLLPTSVSLCGTDLALIEKALHGQLPKESMAKVVGHEAAGFIVGVGANVKNWKIGQYVCLDSHFGCGSHDHHSFHDCVMSGKSCDGIAGGIRGALKDDGTRAEPYDGYWSRVIAIPASALPIKLPLDIAQHLKAPSTLESLGNLYMIIGQMKKIGLTQNPEKTLCIVSGLGATGYPMAAVATHYGFHVVGINPSEGKRAFALQQGAVQSAYQTLQEVASELPTYENIVIVVTADHPAAHEDALQFLHEHAQTHKRKVAIMFGLYADLKQPIAGAPQEYATLPQRDFVFSRKSFTTEDGVEVYGVCGRDIDAWNSLMHDLQPQNNQPPHLVEMLNAAQLQTTGDDVLEGIATTLNKGAEHVEETLRSQNALKLVANFLKK